MKPLYSDIARGQAYQDRLLDFIRREYRIGPTGISPAKRGYYGETWQLLAGDERYFLKLDYSPHREIYRRSFPVIEHLNAHGIDFISQIVKTSQGALYAEFDGAVLGAFRWIGGENIETDETKGPEYRMLAKVYAVPAGGLDILREDFSGDSAAAFFRRWERLEEDAGAEDVLRLFVQNREMLRRRAERLEYFAKRCHGDESGFVITHGDAGGNLLKDGERYYLVDWDAPMLAPPERDAWVMCPRDWARALFEQSLRREGIDYALQPERLAYYCYHMFFFYLTELLDGYAKAGMAEESKAYFAGWIEERLEYADTLCI